MNDDNYYDYNCLTCGACCATRIFDGAYVTIPRDHYDKMSPEAKTFTVMDDGIPAMRLASSYDDSKACAALRGRPGCNVSCAIYNERPPACRKFEPGSMQCDLARKNVLGLSMK